MHRISSFIPLTIFAAIIFLLLVKTPSFAEENKHQCLDNLEEIFDAAPSSKTVEFCGGFHPGWTFKILPFTGHNGILTNGTPLHLFDFRQPKWRKGQPNTLSFELELHRPDVPNLFRLKFRDGETVYDREGKRTYFLWGRDIRKGWGNHGPYGSRWDPVRFIRCLTLSGYGCVTYYDVIVCRDFRYPEFPHYRPGERMEPVISVSTGNPEDSEDLLANFDLAHNLIEESLERLLDHSCRQGGNDG